MSKTKIAWTQHTWNPIKGCTPISEGCAECYAKRIAQRFDGGGFKPRMIPERLDEPLKWRKPRMVFVGSMGDIFHEDINESFIDDIYHTMGAAQRLRGHIFQILTKRPQRINELKSYKKFKELHIFPKNLHLGVSIENQKAADERIPHLLNTPAAVWFVSLEPLLGPIKLAGFDGKIYRPWLETKAWKAAIDWVIVGGETGPGARECREEWVQDIYDQCQEAGVPFFFKSAGSNWIPNLCDCNHCRPQSITYEENIRKWETRREWPR